jgi:hypothetical protein
MEAETTHARRPVGGTFVIATAVLHSTSHETLRRVECRPFISSLPLRALDGVCSCGPSDALPEDLKRAVQRSTLQFLRRRFSTRSNAAPEPDQVALINTEDWLLKCRPHFRALNFRHMQGHTDRLAYPQFRSSEPALCPPMNVSICILFNSGIPPIKLMATYKHVYLTADIHAKARVD